MGKSIAIWFGFLPLIYAANIYSPFEIPKAWYVILFVMILACVSLFSSKINRYKFTLFSSLPILLVMTLFFSSMLNHTFLQSLFGNPARFDGLFTLVHLVVFSIIIGIVWDHAWDKLFCIGVSAGSIVVSLINIVLIMGKNSFSYGFGNPNILAGYLAVTTVFTLWNITQSTKYYKVFWILGLMTQIAAIYLAKSWGGLLGIAITFLLFMTKKINIYHLFIGAVLT
ncbi:MAG: hypothetical protein WAV40_03610, partial [Microgenomates group bacterium]